MARGKLRVARRELDDTLVPRGDDTLLVDAQGRKHYAVEDTPVPHQSPLTRALVAMTFGLWPFGRTAEVPAVREDRNETRCGHMACVMYYVKTGKHACIEGGGK